MFQDIRSASLAQDRAEAFSQFTREFGQVIGDVHDTTPLTCSPAIISIPNDSLFDRGDVGAISDFRFLHHMFQHLPIGDNLYESNHSRYVRLLHIITLTERQIRTYHQDISSLNKKSTINSVWLTHDLMENVFHKWYQDAIDIFFTHYPERRNDLSALNPREQFVLTFRACHFVYSPKSEFLSNPEISSYLSLEYPIVITFDPDEGHFLTWTTVYPCTSLIHQASSTDYFPQDLMWFAHMCSRLFPASSPDPLVQCPVHEISFRFRAERNLYTPQQPELFEDHNDIPRVEQLDDVELEVEEKQVDNQLHSTRRRKCKYSDLSERSLMCHGEELPPVNPVSRIREAFPWDPYGSRHLYGSVSDIENADRGAFMCHRAEDIGIFLGWYREGDQKADKDSSETVTTYRFHDIEADVYRDAWDSKNRRPTCLVALINDPLDPKLWNAEFRTVNNKIGAYTIRPIREDGEVYTAYGNEYFMDFSYPLPLRRRARECYDPKHLDTRWDRFVVDQPEDVVPLSDIVQLDDVIVQPDEAPLIDIVSVASSTKIAVIPSAPLVVSTRTVLPAAVNKDKRRYVPKSTDKPCLRLKLQRRFEKINRSWSTTEERWAMIADTLFPLLSTGKSLFDSFAWVRYLQQCTRFVLADSDSTDGSIKVVAARASGELQSLSPTAVDDDVSAFLIDHESVAPINRLHRVILQRTALLRMGEDLPLGTTPPAHRLSENQLRNVYSSFDRMLSPNRSFIDSLVELLREGQKLIQTPTWCPNGGRGYTVPKNLDDYKLLLEHDLAKRHGEGKVVILPHALCQEHDIMRHIHVSPLVIAPKSGKLSRVCLNLSFTSRHRTEIFPSYNDGVDTDRAYADHYPHDPLPTLVAICTMMNRQRRYWSTIYPDLASLDGFTVDMASAFQQFAATPEKTCTAATIQNVHGVECVVFSTTGVFGDRLAGDSYNLIGRAVDHRHNQMLPHIVDEDGPIPHSVCYVDDGIGVAPHIPLLPTVDDTPNYSICPRQVDQTPTPCACNLCSPHKDANLVIYQAQQWYRKCLEELRGLGCSAPDKAQVYHHHLLAIGWEFNLNFDRWYVQPQPKALKKLAYYLFTRYDPVRGTISSQDLDTLTGLLCYYTAGLIPAAGSYVYNLFQSKRRRHKDDPNLVCLSDAARSDLVWWQAIVFAVHQHPEAFGASISSYDVARTPTWFICTDASSTVGGGGWLSTVREPQQSSDLHDVFFLRWSPEELHEFESLSKVIHTGNQSLEVPDVSPLFTVSINILEFAAALFALTKWGPLLRDSVVSFGTDNTATVSWLTRARAKASSADRLLKTYSLVCLTYGIQLATYHIPGVDNHLADILSRHPQCHEDIDLTPLAVDIASYSLPSAVFIAKVVAHHDHLQSRGILSRTIVMAAVFRHSHYDSDEILALVNLLARTSSYPLSAYAPRFLCDLIFVFPPETEEVV